MTERAWKRTDGGGGTYRYVWEGLLNGDTGIPVVAGVASMTFQVFGKFGVGGKVVLEGSCEERVGDDYHFFVLRDQGDAPVSFWKSGGTAISIVVAGLRPYVVGGDDQTFLTAIVLMRRK